MKKQQENKKNVYLNHIEQDEWNDLQAYHIESKLAWRNIALLAIIALMVVAIYSMYLVNQDKHRTLIFEKDNLGNITALGLATRTFNVDNKIVAHQLYNFIVALREVPLDVALKRKNIEIVHKMIDPKIRDSIDKLLIAEYLKAKDRQITINVTSLKPLEGGKSWEIAWQESLMNEVGKVLDTASWSTIVTFKRLDTVAPDVEIINPIGLFITYLHPTEDISSKGV